MKEIKIVAILAMVGMLLSACNSNITKLQEQFDLESKYTNEFDYENTIESLNKAIKIDPQNIGAYKKLAEIYGKSGRVDEARDTLESALDIAGLSTKNENELNMRLKNLEFLVMVSEIPGEYDEIMEVELGNKYGYDIYYTIESKDNRLIAKDLKYTEPILLDEDGKYILKAYTIDKYGETHDEVVVNYIIKLPKGGVGKDSWEKVGDIYRYRGKNGKIVRGWQDIDGKWYYFGEDGAMLTSWQDINSKWYYFGEDGAMETGWKQIGDKWYYLLNTGELSIGWQDIDGKWYYFADTGEMTTEGTNTTIESSENTDYKKLYRDVLTKLYTKHELEGVYGYEADAVKGVSESHEAKYTLMDITGDGKEELIIYVGMGMTGIYGIKNGKISVLLNTYIDDGCYILDNNSIVVTYRIHNTAPHTGPTNSGTGFVHYIYNQQNSKFEKYRDGEAINPESEEYNPEDSRYFNDLMSKVLMETWEGANIPVTPENIESLK